ncbi:MAG TPA: hypothetical protein DC024_13290 [Clostridiales bacterium]|nr:hypothetical protein [Clostridiales bacterium]HCS09995.1 hypothetical protein [Clostridiales bacterium]
MNTIETDNIKKMPDEDCSVNEDMFPCLGKCCRKNDAPFSSSYKKVCRHCNISTSLPYGRDLKIVIIFECSRFGYGKRVTE